MHGKYILRSAMYILYPLEFETRIYANVTFESTLITNSSETIITHFCD